MKTGSKFKEIIKSSSEYREMLKPPRVGEIVEGKVIEKDKRGVFVDLLNYKVGIIRKNDLNQSNKTLSSIKEGEELTVKIIDLEDEEGFVVLSLKEAEEDLSWQEFKRYQEEGKDLSFKVAGANKGGLVFNLSGFQGFLPASQLKPEHYPRVKNPTPEKILEKLKELVGKKVNVKVIKVDQKEKKLILSEKAVAQDKSQTSGEKSTSSITKQSKEGEAKTTKSTASSKSKSQSTKSASKKEDTQKENK